MTLLVRSRVLLALALLAIPACAQTAAGPVTAPPAVASASPIAVPSASSFPSRHVYRFDFALTLTEPGKAPVVTEHTLNMESGKAGEVRMGRNVPLTAGPPPAVPHTAPPSAPRARPGRGTPPSPPNPAGTSDETPAPPRPVARQDVGFFLRSSFDQQGGATLLRADVEMSNVDEAGAIQRLVVRGEAPLLPGEQVLVASSEDPVTHRKLSLSVTAHLLR